MTRKDNLSLSHTAWLPYTDKVQRVGTAYLSQACSFVRASTCYEPAGVALIMHAPSMSPDGCAMERLGAGACEPVSLLTPSLMRMEPRLPPLSALAAGPEPAGPAPDTAGRPSPLAAGPGADTGCAVIEDPQCGQQLTEA